jgi:putative Holliday junction resolvase
MRLIGLDVGDRTIGVALSDPLGLIAQGMEVIRRKGIENDFKRLGELIEQYSVEKGVIGLPKNMDGSVGPQAEKVMKFANVFKIRFDIPVVMTDERLTTVAAEKMLISADVSRAKRKQVIDKMAAVFILQGYLDGMQRE